MELYQVQQSLAKQQLHLEKTHENHNLISQMREKAERELAQVRADHGASLKEVKVYRSKYDKYKVCATRARSISVRRQCPRAALHLSLRATSALPPAASPSPRHAFAARRWR